MKLQKLKFRKQSLTKCGNGCNKRILIAFSGTSGPSQAMLDYLNLAAIVTQRLLENPFDLE